MGMLSVAVVGAGAVGSYFGGMLARGGTPVTLIGRQEHVEAIRRSGLRIERGRESESIEVGASTSLRELADANLVLVCVKTPDTETVAREIAQHLKGETLVLSLQNGVDNVQRIHSAAGIVAAAGIVYVAADLVAPGRVRHGGRGDLIVGSLPEMPLDPGAERPRLAAVAQQFERCGVPCRVVDDVRVDLWIKMVMNCAYNAISAVGRVQYGELIADPAVRALMREVVHEVVAVALASGVELHEAELERAVFDLGRAMPQATSSTAQDLARGRRTEIDSLNGFVAREGQRLGVAVPYNRTLHTLVKLLESRVAQTGR
jgi:2-dehydropantoate 2-reductase